MKIKVNMTADGVRLPQSEPVARNRADAANAIDRYLRNNLNDSDYAEFSADLETVYTAPAIVPLTDEQIIAIANSIDDDACDQSQTTAFARAIERAHGIGDKPDA